MKLTKLTTLLSILLLIFTTACAQDGKPANPANPATHEIPQYNWKPITEKYPEILPNRNNTLKEIRSSIARKETKEDGTFITYTCYDKNNRITAVVKERKGINNEGVGTGKSGSHRIYRFVPEEEGYVYDEKGRMKTKLFINAGSLAETGWNEYSVKNEKEENKKSFILGKNEIYPQSTVVTGYSYDENDKLVKETITAATDFFGMYKKTVKEYETEKLKKEFIKEDREGENKPSSQTLIYVEISKEYDENGKMIKKYVLRRNKHNAIRSDTNVDLIKGEIVTKYYDGDKAFATVTETSVENNKAIVKRERAGEEFVIWDFVLYKEFAYINRYYVEKKTSKINYEFRNTKSSYNWNYKDDENGLNNLSYRYEKFYSKDLNEDIGDSISKSGEIYKYDKLEIKKLKLEKSYMFRYMANEVYIPEKEYLKNITKITVLENTTISEEQTIFNLEKIKINFIRGEINK